jgi:hypothetical protein
MAMKYPTVRSEEETIARVLAGASISRYGDGEFKIAAGNGCVSQIPDKRLTTELREILCKTNPKCIVGIPRLDPRSPKIENWRKYKDIYPRFLSPAVDYYSAFITRPDSAPWIYTKEFFGKIESLWREQRVILVSGSDRSLTTDFLYQRGVKQVRHVECARRDAYAQIDDLELQIRSECANWGIKRVLLCCGPTATCLAWRLSDALHAIDLGHIGMFWFNGEEKPKWMRSRSEKNLDSGGQTTSKGKSSITTC